MKQEELNSILRLHKAWLIGEDGGERANLQGKFLEGVDLQYSDLRNSILHGINFKDAILEHADLSGANLHRANLNQADMRGADLDYASWPLWCGSLKAYVDDRIAIQLLYHTLSVVQHSPFVSEEVKKALLSEGNVRIANRFHRVGECGEIKEWEEGTK